MWGRGDRVIVTSGLSKAYGLPGLRIGWIAGSPALVESTWSYHDYTTIAPGALSDRLARVALDPTRRAAIIARTRRIVRENLPLMEAWLRDHSPAFQWTPPEAGAIVFARHARAAQRLAAQFENRTVSKAYWAFVEGVVTPIEGTWTDHLNKRHGMAQAEVVEASHPAAKHAVLHYRVLWQTAAGAWLEIELETGRTHQIRIQAASRGHAVVGDAQYGSHATFGDPMLAERDRPIALHARHLAFRHPMIDALVDVTAPLPASWGALNLPTELLQI